MGDPLVSVVIPTFNSERFLEKCFRSIRDQTYKNIEIIVVDNYSKDKTREIVKNHEGKIILVEANRSEARNIGAENASGDLIFFVDSDMELDSRVVRECVKTINGGSDAVIIPEISVGKGFWASCKALEKACYIGDDSIEAARLFKKNVLEVVHGYDPGLEAGEDWDLNQRVKKKGFEVGRCNALIKHNEGELRLRETIKRKYHYGKTIEKYRSKHSPESKVQLVIIRPAFMRNWRKFAGEPARLIGMLIMKFCELGAGALGVLASKVSRIEETN